MNRPLIALLAGLFAVAAGFLGAGLTPALAQKPAKPLEITWEELMPEGEEERILELYEAYFQAVGANASSVAEGSASDTMPQIGTYNTVQALNNRSIRIPGYIVPFDFSPKETYREFLLVPYFGACIHTPPPPPNQIIYVTVKSGVKIKDIWAPVWLEGVLTTKKHTNDLGNAAYTLSMTKLEPYDS